MSDKVAISLMLYILQSCPIGAYDVDLILPGKSNTVISTPLYVFRDRSDLGVIFAEFVLKVTAHDPDLSIVCVQGNETLTCRNGPLTRTLSSASVASTTKIVLPTARRTSTERESVYAGGIKLHE